MYGLWSPVTWNIPVEKDSCPHAVLGRRSIVRRTKKTLVKIEGWVDVCPVPTDLHNGACPRSALVGRWLSNSFLIMIIVFYVINLAVKCIICHYNAPQPE